MQYDAITPDDVRKLKGEERMKAMEVLMKRSKQNITVSEIVLIKSEANDAAYSGDYKKAKSLYEKAIAECQKISMSDPERGKFETAKINVELAGLYEQYCDSPSEAYSILKNVIQDLLDVEKCGFKDYKDVLAEAYFLFGKLSQLFSHKEDACKALTASATIYAKLNTETLGEYDFRLAEVCQTLAFYYRNEEDNLVRSEELCNDALVIARRLVANGVFPFGYFFDSVSSDLVEILFETQKYNEAVAVLTDCLNVNYKILDGTPRESNMREYLNAYKSIADNTGKLAFAYGKIKEYDKAELLYEKSINMLKNLLNSDFYNNNDCEPDLAFTYDKYAEYCREKGDKDKAVTLYQKALEIIERYKDINIDCYGLWAKDTYFYVRKGLAGFSL